MKEICYKLASLMILLQIGFAVVPGEKKMTDTEWLTAWAGFLLILAAAFFIAGIENHSEELVLGAIAVMAGGLHVVKTIIKKLNVMKNED